MLLRLLVVTIILGLCGPSFAAEESEVFAHRFTAAEVGGSAPLQAIAVGSDGRVYVGSASGLHEFDGEKWRAVAGLRSGPIQAVAVDERGRVWFVGRTQFGLLERGTDGSLGARLLATPDSLAGSESGTPRRTIVFRGAETYIVFGSRGLMVRVAADFSARVITAGAPISSAHAWAGEIYLQTGSAGFRVDGDRVERLPDTNPLWRSSTQRIVRGIWPDPSGEIWTASSLALRRARADGVVAVTRDFSTQLGAARIQQAVPLADGLVAIGTPTVGAWIVDTEGEIRQRLAAKTGLGEGGDDINGLAADAEGRLWIAHAGGVACIDPAKVASPPRAASASVAPRFSGMPLKRLFTVKQMGVVRQRSVAVHPNGLVYTGSDSGLLEFDGVAWRTLPGTGRRLVCQVAIDEGGRVFYGANQAFGMLVPDAHGTLTARPLQTLLPPADQDVDMVSQLITSGHEAYFGLSSRNLVVRVDAEGKPHAIRLPEAPGVLHAWAGAVYVQTAQSCYRIVDDRAQPAEAASPGLKGTATARVLDLWADGAGGAWQASTTGLRHWQGNDAPLVSRAVSNLLRNDRVTTGCPIGDGTIALGTRSHGVLRIDAKGAVLAQYDEESGCGLGSSTVSDVAMDLEGGLWVAHDGGLTRLQVRSMAALHGVAAGLRGSVRAMAIHGGRLYVGTTQGLYVRDPQTGRFSVQRRVFPPVTALASTPSGLVVAGPRLSVLHDDDTLETIESSTFSLNSLAVLPHDPDRVVGGALTGLRLYRREAGRWHLEGEVSGARDQLLQLTFDDAGWLWGMRGGVRVVRIDWRQGPQLDAKVETLGAAQGLPDFIDEHATTRIIALEGAVTFANRAGLMRHDRATDRFVPETRIAGLTTATASRYLAAWRGDGLFALKPIGGRQFGWATRSGPGVWQMQWQPYTGVESLLPDAILDDPASGAIWLGDENLVSIEPGVAALVPPLPAARVRRVMPVDGQEVIWGGTGALASGPLPPERNGLRFYFAAPSYMADADDSLEVNYRVKLEGFDHDWSQWGAETERTYTNLPPGPFTFRVQARGDDHRVGPESSFAFTLQPPWWRTWWFLGFAGLVGVTTVAGLTRWVAVRALRRRVALLEAQSAVERERLRLARDLHDEVGSGLGRVILFADEAEGAGDDRVQRQASLDRVRTSARELVQHAREIVWAVSPQNDPLTNVITRLADYTEDTLFAAGITCRVELPPPEAIPAIKLGSEERHSVFMAVKEAVHNCVKYSETKTAELIIAVTPEDFVVTLRDHGRGFAPGEVRGTGHGTKNIVARAEALGGSAEITSQPGQGTTVVFRVPVRRASGL